MGRSFRSRAQGAPLSVDIEEYNPEEESDDDDVGPSPANHTAGRVPPLAAPVTPSLGSGGCARDAGLGAGVHGVAPTPTPPHLSTPPLTPVPSPSSQPEFFPPPRAPTLPPGPPPLPCPHQDSLGAGAADAEPRGAPLVDGVPGGASGVWDGPNVEQAWQFFCEDASASPSENASSTTDGEVIDGKEGDDGCGGGEPGGWDDPPGEMGAEFGEQEDVAPGSCPFRTMEDFFSFLLLHGPGHFTERTFNIARAFINHDRPPGKRIPGVTTVRETIAPAVMRTCGLPLCESETQPPFLYVLPSAHVQPDFQSAATFNRFFVADNRDETSRELEPEFYDTKFFQNRAASLSPGPDLPCFGLASRRFGVSSFVDVVLDDGAVHH